ncbi:transposase [Paenibacillus alvei]|uniref:Transposase n=1 Tax=Paenibacillus alvei TaxID=44250 RepID=A0AAP7DKP3_PAEAL|nr:transposase [Paenibacillus alvei]
MRWGIETSFRALKYIVGLTNFHAKKRESITQKIFARMILYISLK